MKSIRSRVANISEFLREPLTVAEFRRKLLASIFGGAEAPEYKLSEADWEAVRKLADERYRSWDWNYGKSPAFNIRQTKRVEGVGTFDVRLDVRNGQIAEAAVFGDFFGVLEAGEFAQRLVGLKYDEAAVRDMLETCELTPYFGPITKEQWLELMF